MWSGSAGSRSTSGAGMLSAHEFLREHTPAAPSAVSRACMKRFSKTAIGLGHDISAGERIAPDDPYPALSLTDIDCEITKSATN